MDVCEICGGSDASHACTGCGRRICHRCFHSERDLCSICVDLTEAGPLFSVRDQSSVFGKLFPLGFALVFIGMSLMMIALTLSVPSGGGVIGIFPFFLVTVSETVAVVLVIALILVSLAFIVLPWILGPRKTLRIFERISGVKTDKTSGRSRSPLGVEEYLITLKMPGYKESDIDVQVFEDELIVQAYKNGEVFKRTYDLPMGFEPRGVKYKQEGDFLIIKVSLKRKEDVWCPD